jgi:hypothetical protein
MTEFQVGFNGVKPLVLQLVSLQFVDEPDASPLMVRDVKQNSFPLSGNPFKG